MSFCLQKSSLAIVRKEGREGSGGGREREERSRGWGEDLAQMESIFLPSAKHPAQGPGFNQQKGWAWLKRKKKKITRKLGMAA